MLLIELNSYKNPVSYNQQKSISWKEEDQILAIRL